MKAAVPQRPFPVTVICSIGFLFLLLSLLPICNVSYFIGASYAQFTALVTLGCLIGLWKMQKLALYIYFCVFSVNQLVLIFLGHWNFNSLFIPLIIIAITSIYHHKMN